MKETNLMKRSLEKMRARTTHYFWGREHPSFLGARAPIILRGLEHLLFKRARALIIQRQLIREQVNKCKMDMKEIKFLKCSSKKMRARTHYFRRA